MFHRLTMLIPYRRLDSYLIPSMRIQELAHVRDDSAERRVSSASDTCEALQPFDLPGQRQVAGHAHANDDVPYW